MLKLYEDGKKAAEKIPEWIRESINKKTSKRENKIKNFK